MSEADRPQHLPDEALVDLMHGLATHDERNTALAHIEDCPECETRFVGVWRDREVGRLGPPGAVRKRRLARVLVPLTAAAALVLVVLLLPHRGAPLLSADWLALDATEGIARGEGSCDHDVPVAGAVAAYRAHDAAQVVAMLGGRELPPSCDPLRLVLASALVHTGDPAGSLRVLDGLQVETLPQPARDRGLWIQALALDRLGRRDETIAILDRLAKGQGEFREPASRVLRSQSPVPRSTQPAQ